ncbi:hypothetical protein AADZ90_017395 [Aestuariibius sp. 2305UL40-4]|uniref:hypothetical protein n=1 Tax=Aestuariibius violaceus TaxID=3234132 RepID=UPI00345E92AF
MTPADWPSLQPQIALAQRLGPPHEAALTAWLAEQDTRRTDPAFARLFSDHISLPGIAPGDYAHRLVRSRHGNLLGGIRFYGQDISRPFVEIVAHSFPDLPSLAACVATEWSPFAPTDLRLLTAEPLPPPARTDMTIHAAPCGQMSPPDGRVRLTIPDSPDLAISLVKQRYTDLAETDPTLAANLQPANPEDLRDWHAAGALRLILVDNQPVGCLIITDGAVAWLNGDEVMEEVIATHATGQSYAASAQMAWAAEPGRAPTRLLTGTIDTANPASRHSAQKAGRPVVLRYVFVPLS